MLDLKHHHVRTAGFTAGSQSLLVVLSVAQRFQVPRNREKKDDRSESDESDIELKAVGGINGHASLNGSALPNGKSRHSSDAVGISVKANGAR